MDGERVSDADSENHWNCYNYCENSKKKKSAATAAEWKKPWSYSLLQLDVENKIDSMGIFPANSQWLY